MEPTLVEIKTTVGPKTIAGHKINDRFFIHKNGGIWTVTHLLSGYAIAHFYSKDAAIAVATILMNLRCDWEWSELSMMPSETKETCQQIFEQLCKVVKFARTSR